MAGKKDDAFVKVLTAGFDRYRAIGTRETAVRNILVEPIDVIRPGAKVGSSGDTTLT